MSRGRLLITDLWSILTLLDLRRFATHFIFSHYFFGAGLLLVHSWWAGIYNSGDFDTNSSGYCDGICFWWRAFWSNLQCWTLQRGWGSLIFFSPFFLVFYFFKSSHSLQDCNILKLSESLFMLQARFFFQQLISGVSYCHSMVLKV